MPEASVHKHGNTRTAKDKVRSATNFGNGSESHAEAQAHSMKRRAKSEFRSRVAMPVLQHRASDGIRRCPRAFRRSPALWVIGLEVATWHDVRVRPAGD